MTHHLVIGGCGFLGRHIARGLAKRGERVTVVDRGAFPISDFPAESVVCDLSQASPADFDRLVGDAAVVHHYAWSTIPSTANEAPFDDLKDNVGLTLGVLDALRRRGGGRIVFASSGGTVYGKLRTIPVPETHPLQPITAYGVSKVTAENYLDFYAYLHGIDVRVARISNPYGAGQSAARPQGAVTAFVHRALARQSIDIWGDGEVVRDFIHVSDLVDAMLALTDAPPVTGGSAIFNIGSGLGASLNEIVRTLEHEMGNPVALNRLAARPFDVPVNILDVTRAKQTLGWRPQISLRSGIRRMIADLTEDTDRLFSS